MKSQHEYKEDIDSVTIICDFGNKTFPGNKACKRQATSIMSFHSCQEKPDMFVFCASHVFAATGTYKQIFEEGPKMCGNCDEVMESVSDMVLRIETL